MAQPAHPQAMAPLRPGRTRTAPPQRPAKSPFRGNYGVHTLFGASGLVYVLLGLLVLESVWALGSGPEAWSRMQGVYERPFMIALHAICLASVVFVGVRVFALFPKAQPPRIGPAKPPPRPVILALLYAAWIGVGGAFAAILLGGIF